MLGNFRVVSLIGTTRGNQELFQKVDEELTAAGNIVFRPTFYRLEVYLRYKDMIDAMCEEKLYACDDVCIVTPNHIGESTTKRIKQALELHKDIYIWDDLDNYCYNVTNNIVFDDNGKFQRFGPVD